MVEHATGSNPPSSTTAEHALVQRLQQGDVVAFDELFHRYVAKVSRQAIQLLGNTADAEEVVQEVFLTLYTKAQTFRGEAALSTWLYRLTANAAISKLRRRRHQNELSLDEYLPSFQADGHHAVRPVVDWSSTCEEHMARTEMLRLLQDAVEQLPPVDKAVVVLSDLEGLSNREIAEALELSVAAVKARLHRARLFLRGKVTASLGYSPA